MGVSEPPQLEQIAEQVKKALMMPSADYSNGEVAAAPTCSFGDAVRAGAALIELVRLAGERESLQEEYDALAADFNAECDRRRKIAGERDTLKRATETAEAWLHGIAIANTHHTEEFLRDEARRGLDALRAALTSVAPPECDHEWVDARNEYVMSGELCAKCSSLRCGDGSVIPAYPPKPLPVREPQGE